MIYIALAILGFVAILLVFRLLSSISKRRNRLTVSQVADTIEKHIKGTDGPWDWDEFTSIAAPDPRLNAVRLRCIDLDGLVLPDQRNRELEKIVADLRAEGRS
ncbi:MAG TPA: hypothetical protein VGW37_02365 [Terriglobia bacterium]|nr:hypothetical protein [Terriglobia bacterium]